MSLQPLAFRPFIFASALIMHALRRHSKRQAWAFRWALPGTRATAKSLPRSKHSSRIRRIAETWARAAPPRWTVWAPIASRPILPRRLPCAESCRSRPRNDKCSRLDACLRPVAGLFRCDADAGWRKGFKVFPEARPTPVVKKLERANAARRRKPGDGGRRAHDEIECAKHGRRGVNLVLLVKIGR